MDIADFDYHLPPELISQEPMNPREKANLMVISKETGAIEHKHIGDLPSLLQPSDILVVNNTKVFRARLSATIHRDNLPDKKAELFLVKPVGPSWQAIGKPGKAFSPGATVEIANDFKGIIEKNDNTGTFLITFPLSNDEVIDKANIYGSVPIPPYIKEMPSSPDNHDPYQTSYAKVTGSVAAPTAGFHITPHLLEQFKQKDILVIEVTLHVGLGTFLPVKTATVEDHTMHSEFVNLSQETADILNQAKKDGRRIIAIGTTTTRALEGTAQIIHNSVSTVQNGNQHSKFLSLTSYSGDVNIFITPGYTFQVVDGLLTNFHLPKSTLLMLVSAFTGSDTIKNAYKEAVKNRYRFYSFGDAMLII